MEDIHPTEQLKRLAFIVFPHVNNEVEHVIARLGHRQLGRQAAKTALSETLKTVTQSGPQGETVT